MGRVVLLIRGGLALLLLGTFACGPANAQDATSSAAPDPHADQLCVTCHRADQAELGEAAVPSSACAASGCHTDQGPAEIQLSTVQFSHRGHGGDSLSVAMECAGCHSHDAGGEPITAGTDACTLCHSGLLRGEGGGDCRYCHNNPTFEGFTSQGVAIPHEELPWIQGECVRCHYDVAEPPTRVSAVRCATCHVDRSRITAAGIGEDLHPDHTGVGCTACHSAGDHHIVAMSSAVDLECSQCHVRAHDLDVTSSFPRANTCNDCHRPVHQEEQRLVLGVVPDIAASPSEKFLDGLTCRSCHIGRPAPSGNGGAVATSASCSGCHRPEYATVLRWWSQGSEQRRALSDTYVRRAEGALAEETGDSVQTLLEGARGLVDLVSRGGGEHNIPLSHQAFVESVARAEAAYVAAGWSAPPPPDLGRRPRMGLCSYCHYRVDQASLPPPSAAEERFHREVLGVREMTRGGS
jgi:hypothetical protein